MKFKTLILVFLSSLSLATFSQVTDLESTLKKRSADTVLGWKHGGMVSINVAQTSLTNWAAGGQNSVALNGLTSLYLNYKGEKSSWVNSLDLGYGLLKQGKESDYMKTDDKVDILSLYGRRAIDKLYYAAMFNFKTQMTDGYNYPNDSVKISGLFAPAYVLGAVGMDYKPSDYFSAFISPLTSKTTFVNDQTLADSGAFGVDPAEFDNENILLEHGKKVKSEVGGYIRFIFSKNDFNTDFLENITLSSKIDLFSNYIQNPGNIDVNWENLIALKVNKYIAVSVTTNLIYDDDIKIDIDNNNDGVVDESGPRVQFKEILGVGFSYKF
ncbi:MAG: DUF3078 domain-containing protein [Bacteroidales bacterium]|nr:DUF3078 domain-containing protein [Bacteroidales bacterium]MBN2818272.1 DUF3078 domain-containing protein [Bacteroidales bacterium]